MKIVKVTLEKGWSTYFVQKLYKGIDFESIWKVCDDRGWPCVMDSTMAEVLDADEIADWAERAGEVFVGDIKTLVKEIKFFLEQQTPWLRSSMSSDGTIVETWDAPIIFGADFVEDVKAATGGRFLNVQYLNEDCNS